MNKKVLTGCLALAVCLSASAPLYRYLTLNESNPDLSALQSNSLLTDKVPSEAKVLRNDYLELRKLYLDDSESLSEPQNTTLQATATAAAGADTAAKTAAGTSEKTSAAPAKATAATKTAAKKSVSKPKTLQKATASSSRGTTATASKSSSKTSAVINTAKSYIGVPYVWGGASPSGFDCSGFTQYVLKKNGITIPRVTSDQFKTGVSVSKSNLRAGDLVFFTTYKAGPSHVGFYIGNGNFIHASSSKGVTISSLSNSYFADRYLGARRVI